MESEEPLPRTTDGRRLFRCNNERITMDPVEKYGKPLLDEQELENCLRNLESEFTEELRDHYTDAEIAQMEDDDNFGAGPTKAELEGRSAIDFMLHQQRIDSEGLNTLLNRMGHGAVIQMRQFRESGASEGEAQARALVISLLGAFQLGWMAHKRREELVNAEAAVSDATRG